MSPVNHGYEDTPPYQGRLETGVAARPRWSLSWTPNVVMGWQGTPISILEVPNPPETEQNIEAKGVTDQVQANPGPVGIARESA